MNDEVADWSSTGTPQRRALISCKWMCRKLKQLVMLTFIAAFPFTILTFQQMGMFIMFTHGGPIQLYSTDGVMCRLLGLQNVFNQCWNNSGAWTWLRLCVSVCMHAYLHSLFSVSPLRPEAPYSALGELRRTLILYLFLTYMLIHCLFICVCIYMYMYVSCLQLYILSTHNC